MLEYEVDNERLLIEAAQQDPARFAELYESNFQRVYAFLLRRVGSREEAEGLTAEVFHQALASISRFEWRGRPFVAWLLGIAGNILRDRWQRVTRQRLADETGSPSSGGKIELVSAIWRYRARRLQRSS